MVKAVFAIPGHIDTPTGGYIYDRRVMAMMPSFGVTAQHLRLPDGFPNPSDDDVRAAADLLSRADPEAKLIVDGLALGAMPLDALKPFADRLIALIHYPLAHKSGLMPARRDALVQSERAALSCVDKVIATSIETRTRLVEDYGVAPEAITVAEPGTDPAPRATGTGTPLQLLSVGSIEASKRFEALVEALTPLAHLDWRLTIVGALDRDAEVVSALRAKIAKLRLGDRITLAGVVVPATLARHYDSADIFVMPAHFEGYAMALSEAMVRGLSIVLMNGGAFEQVVPSDAALRVSARDGEAINEVFKVVLSDRKLRARLADAAWDAGRLLPTWNETARRVGACIMGLSV